MLILSFIQPADYFGTPSLLLFSQSVFVFIFYMQSILTPVNIANEPTNQSSRTSSHLQ